MSNKYIETVRSPRDSCVFEYVYVFMNLHAKHCVFFCRQIHSAISDICSLSGVRDSTNNTRIPLTVNSLVIV